MTDLVNAALKYARSGRAVFPCNPDKSPRTIGGFKSATMSDFVIKGMNWEGGMIGAEIPYGQIIIDIDPRNGGDETVAVLNGGLTKTKTAMTRSGGTHLYYTVDPALKLRSSLGPGVDVKQHGKGYVIVPPSEGYVWSRGETRAQPAPQWLIEELVVEERDAAASAPSAPKFFEGLERGTPYGVKALDAELGRLATAGPGERNNTLNRAAFSLAQLVAGGGLDEGAARDGLVTVAYQIGLEIEETQKTIESGWRAGEQEPRQAPDDKLELDKAGG